MKFHTQRVLYIHYLKNNMNSLQKNKRAITGIQPSGRPHIGNYFSAMKPIVDLQDSMETYVSIVNYHALTTTQDGKILRNQTYNLVLDYLAIGLDSEKSIFYKQSDVPEHTELTWIFNCLITVPWLERAHAFKDKTEKGFDASVGLFDYPVLMAADILLPNATVVPIGKDQIQHVEMSREIARKFNSIYGKTFIEPQEQVNKNLSIIKGTDGRKMSKSYGNTIPLFGTDAEIKKAIMGIVTDSKKIKDSKNPDKCNIFALHKLITPEPELSEIRKLYENEHFGYSDSKKMLLENYLKFIKPMREKRKYYEDNPGIVRQILDEGRQKIQKIAKAKMKEVLNKVGLD